MTLQTIADHVGVSRMTVSNAFSKPDQLSAELRQRILEVAAELGYAGPDPSARALRSGTTGAVGIMLTDTLDEAFTNEVATAFLGAIAAELERRGLALTLLTAGADDTDAATLTARDVAIDGALIYSCRPSAPGRDWLLRRNLPLVFVDQDPVPDHPALNVDDRGGARAAAAHLAGLGHRRVAALVYLLPDNDGAAPSAGQYHGRSGDERLAGWRDGLGDVELLVVDIAYDASDDVLRTAIRELLTAPDRPTGVLCFSDVMALHVVAVANELGLDLPADLSIVGFDDSRSARFAVPALTTVRQDLLEKGRRSAQLLLDTIDGTGDRAGDRAGDRTGDRAAREPAHVELPTELVIRASTAPPPA